MPASFVGSDRILRQTRWLSGFIIPFLVAACVLLFFWPNHTDRTFAWTIKPSMTPMMLASAYAGGIYYFIGVLLAKRWHEIKVGLLPVTAFASSLGIATLLHWDRFNHSHVSFFTWTALYLTTPFLVIATWLRNRPADPGRREPGDPPIDARWRVFIGAVGSATLLISLPLFLRPSLMIEAWPWKLTALTARVMGAMFALPGVVGLGLAFDERWSSARVILQAQGVSILFILVASARAWSDFDATSAASYLFVGGLAFLEVAIVGFSLSMDARRGVGAVVPGKTLPRPSTLGQ